MDPRTELEAALQERWDDDTLAIYADHLQLQGDPRGELIALDLRGSGPELEHRRGELLRAWLGTGIGVWWDTDHEAWLAGDPSERGSTWASVERGLVEMVYLGGARPDVFPTAVAKLLSGPAGEYVHRMAVRGVTEELRSIVRLLGDRPRPWLRHLAIERLPTVHDPLLEPRAERALIAATPNLRALDVSGSHVLGAFVHPAVRELRIVGDAAMQSLCHGPPLPVRSIDFRFDRHRPGPPPPGAIAGLFRSQRFPALRQLVLADIEPGSQHVFPYLRELDVAPRLARLVLPALRSVDDVAHVQAALDRMPALRTLEIAHAYEAFGDLGSRLRHPYARIALPAPWPWPPFERVFLSDPLLLDGQPLRLGQLIGALEDQFEAMPDAGRAAWTTLWHTVPSLVGEHVVDDRVSIDVLIDAFAALDLRDLCNHELAQVRRFLDERRHATRPGHQVRLSRRTE